MPRFYKRAIFQTHVSFKSAFSATTVFVNAENKNDTQERQFGGGLYVSRVHVGVTVCVCLCVSCSCGCDSVCVTVGVVLWFQRHGQGCSMPL